MAIVRFTSSFEKITGQESINLKAETLGRLCRELVHMYGPKMEILLDESGNISRRIIILVDRRNAQTLSGADTILKEDTEVLLLPFFGGG
ncbi:MAG: MoaD/ThiS family protein [Spirochaetota bacterium]